MVTEYLMFFQNNTRSNQFNQPKVQWHSGNIGYSSVQELHPRLASCDSTQDASTGFLFTYQSAIDSRKLFSKNTFQVE